MEGLNYNADRIRISGKMLRRRFVHVGKSVTDVQILGCQLLQNAFGEIESQQDVTNDLQNSCFGGMMDTAPYADCTVGLEQDSSSSSMSRSAV